MKKISFAAFGVVFGGLVVGGADASIISRSFLDEALESYATTTALSDKIGNAWPYMLEMTPALNYLSWSLYPLEMNLENTSDLVRFLFGGQMESGINQGGVLNLLGQSVVDIGAYDVKTGQIDDGFRSLTQLTNGWTDSKKKSYLGVRGLNDAIGTLPSGAMPEAPVWSDKLFQHMYQEYGVEPIYPTSLAGLMELLFGSSQKDSMGILQRMVAGIPENDGTDDLIGLYPNYVLAKEANDKIGTLPTGTFDIGSPGLNEMFSDGKSFTVNVPSNSTLSELFRNLYQLDASLPSIADVAYKTMFGGQLSQYWAGVYGIPSYKGLIDLTKDVNKIGTLPTGELPRVGFWTDKLLPALGVEPNYPTSLAGLMELLFGNNAHSGILPLIYRGVTVDTDGNGYGDTNIGIVSNYSLATSANATANAASTAAQTAQTTANTAKSTADSAIEKIGRLPTEYSTVGAALSAMDAKIEAKDLPADSDDGQYVLSAKKVGDTITYTWVKMDLTDAEK